MNRMRTPLADASNGRIAEADRDGGGNLGHRLLLVRSELSAMVNQLDQIFARAQEHHNMKSIATNEDIESLYRLLSGMNSSLEPWVSRLGQAQTTSTPAVQFSTHRDRNSSPTNHGIMISPSPLVAWRADGCAPITERQLFLLTPMSKSHESLYRCLKPCFNGKENSNAGKSRMKESVSHGPTFFNSSPQDFKLISEAYKKDSSIRLIEEGVSNKRIDYDDDEEEELEWFLSPPKTCTLMVPDYVSKNPLTVLEKSLCINNPKIPGSMEVSKMPESFQGSNKQKLRDLHLGNSTNKSDSNEPLEWFLSPPKTCILMEPSEGQMSQTPSIIADTVLRSRRPGESTLKKELWTKFQDVPMGGFSYKDSAAQKVAKKGFMDMLEEALLF